MDQAISFEYGGFTFCPLRNLTQQEDDIHHIASRLRAAGSFYINIPGYSHAAFEQAARQAGGYTDLYTVKGITVIPTTPCIYHYAPEGEKLYLLYGREKGRKRFSAVNIISKQVSVPLANATRIPGKSNAAAIAADLQKRNPIFEFEVRPAGPIKE